MYKSGLMELEAVVAIARLGSFRAAALELEMSPTAIGNAVAGRVAICGERWWVHHVERLPIECDAAWRIHRREHRIAICLAVAIVVNQANNAAFSLVG